MKRNDAEIYRAQSFGGTVGIGKRPGLCIVDFVNGFMEASVFGGGYVAAAVAKTVGLLGGAATRSAGGVFTSGLCRRWQ